MATMNALKTSLGVLTIAATIGCGNSPVDPTAPGGTVPAAATATMAGVITGQRPSGMNGSNPPIDSVSVQVIEGPGLGRSATTDRDGKFTLSVPPGSQRLRLSRSGFQTVETGMLTAIDRETVTVQTAPLKTAPWALSGDVTDSLG